MNNLQNLEVLRRLIELLPKLPHIEENLRRESLLESSLFSARIEGNKLKLEDIDFVSIKKETNDIAKIEVSNILKALEFLLSKKTLKKLTKNTILKLHKFVLGNISSSAGCWRHEPSAIFNQAGVAIYLPPPPDEVSHLVEELIEKINSSREPGPVKSALFHFAFEKIHPFLDGNGRVGRLLSTLILKNSGFGFRGLVSLEEYLEKNRQVYYDLMSIGKKDITDFVNFFLDGLKIKAEAAIEKLKDVKRELPEDSLLPRRREILEIVKDHKAVSFNFLKRRFVKVPDSSLHYDLKQLLRAGFIRKLGTTRGVIYTV